MPINPDLWQPPIPIAHRGSRLLWPENTMEAFSGAVSLGYRHVETDVRVTSDGVMVCLHDPTVDRTTDGSGPVAALSFEEVSRLDAGFRHRGEGGHEYRGTGVQVPALEEVVASFPDVSFVADLKADDVVAPLHDMIERLRLQDRIIVGSFSDRRLEVFRELCRDGVATSTGAALSRSWVFASKMGRGVECKAAALQLPLRSRGIRVVDRRLVSVAHARGLQVHVWTVNDPVEMGDLLDMGLDGIITDRPDILKEVLSERGQWPE